MRPFRRGLGYLVSCTMSFGRGLNGCRSESTPPTSQRSCVFCKYQMMLRNSCVSRKSVRLKQRSLLRRVGHVRPLHAREWRQLV
jgi:hypothetical protein